MTSTLLMSGDDEVKIGRVVNSVIDWKDGPSRIAN
jgi:hypothetical protein